MFSILLPTVFAVILYRKLPTSLKVIAGLVFVSILMELISFTMYQMGVNNMPIFHIYTFLEFGLISTYFFLIFKSKLIRVIVVIGFCVLVLFSLNHIMVDRNTEYFNSNQRFIETGILLIYFAAFYFNSIRRTKTPYLEMYPHFMMTTGFLVYFMGTAMIFLYANELNRNGILAYWSIHCGLNVMLNIVYTVVLWRGSRVSKLL